MSDNDKHPPKQQDFTPTPLATIFTNLATAPNSKEEMDQRNLSVRANFVYRIGDLTGTSPANALETARNQYASIGGYWRSIKGK